MLIYELPISLYSFKVRLALRLKGAGVALQAPPGGGYRSAEFRAINPAGTIPALVDGEGCISESDAIIEYLDDIGLGAPLRPRDPRLAARHRMMSRWCDMRLEPEVRRLFPHVDPAVRSAQAVAAIDARIMEQLALIEGGLDAQGLFALSAAPGLADCGLTAVLTWLEALRPELGLSASADRRLARMMAVMAGHACVAAEIQAYRALVADWIASRR